MSIFHKATFKKYIERVLWNVDFVEVTYIVEQDYLESWSLILELAITSDIRLQKAEYSYLLLFLVPGEVL